jgi:hypothetical protein
MSYPYPFIMLNVCYPPSKSIDFLVLFLLGGYRIRRKYTNPDNNLLGMPFTYAKEET